MVGFEYARKLQDMTMKELAERLGVSQQLISMWANKKKKIPLERVPQLALIFNIRKELVGRDVDEIDKREIQDSVNMVNDLNYGNGGYNEMRTHIKNLTYTIEEALVERCCAPNQVPDFQEMNRCIGFLERMIARIKKGEFDD